MQRRSRPLPSRRLLALATTLALYGAAGAAQAGDDVCPLGAFTCPKKPVSYALCKPNALLGFYVPDLPQDPNLREQATTDVDAAELQSPDSNVFHLSGDVRMQRADQLLRTERLDYTRDSTAYSASGGVRYQDHGLLFSADAMQGTTTPNRAHADDVRYQLLQSRGNGVARSAELQDKQHSTFRSVTYSTCDPDARQWELHASSLSIDRASGVGRARNVSMWYDGVPFFYFPYLRFPVDDRRQTGFLYPSLVNSNNAGFSITLPFYLNLAPNYDATLYPRSYSSRGYMLGGEFRFLTESSKGQLEFTYLPDDREAHRDRGSLNFLGSTRVAPGWSFSTNINRVSDAHYFEDFGNSLLSAATSVLGSNAYLNGSGDWWSAGLGVDAYQLTDPTLPVSAEPYKRLPRLYFNGENGMFGEDSGLRWGVRSEAVAFRKPDALEGDRIDLFPYITWPLEGAAWFVRPEVGYRYTAYDLHRDTDNHPSRSVPIADVDAGLIFERDTRLFGDSYTQTLEPRLYYLRVPYRNQDNLPIFDSRLLTFDYWQLFSSNRFAGADRQGDANDLTVALTTRLLDGGGVERMSASIGRIYYFDPQRVQLPGQPDTDFAGSNYVAEFTLQLNDRWRMTASQQWNPNTNTTDVSTVGFQRRIADDGILNFAYRYRRNLLEQYDVSTVFPVNDRWSLVGRWNYSVRDHRTLEAFAGVQYDSCCVAVRLLQRHFVHNFQGQSDNATYFEIEFKGIGNVGQQTGTFLRRAILGYQGYE
ncbi:LPS assembly protein LptD [Mizugakiibacter sediminis]|uniref:LPS-assembly protein LptD n=1 Tax=Mizugakiibacter sediminis TaxID=1475481 RepID=A0A0S6Z241_9GAMM|nr:LPS assembly protein LptD [Mizugakiibacter sediminis]